MSPLSRTLLRVALLLTSVALPATAAELYVRRAMNVTYRAPPAPLPDDAWREVVHRRSELPGLSYELSPGRRVRSHGALVETNAMGLRSYEPLSEAAGVTRIAVVGDSYAFGFGVALSDTFAAILERTLNTPPSPPTGEQPPWEHPLPDEPTASAGSYEVMNFGVGGYSTLDEAVVVEHRVRPWKPALIVLAYSLNDPENAPVQPVHSYYQAVRWWQHSHVLRLLAFRRLQADIARYGGGDYLRYLHAHPEKWGSVRRGMARIAKAATAMGARVLLAVFPHSTVGAWEDYPYRDAHRQVADEGARHGFSVIDLLPVMERQPPRRVRLSQGDDHPNALGHRLAAQALSTYLRTSGLLDD